MTDRIEKTVFLEAPVEKAWHALTDHEQFGSWFRVALEAPFKVGEESVGQITYPGYEHVVWRVRVTAIEPMTRFAFTWHPHGIDPDYDYSVEEPTTITFTLKPEGSGTRLNLVESGFDRLPENRRAEAWRGNDGGWAEQMDNIKAYVES